MSAQETIGTILKDGEPRDAIHFALYAVKSHQALKPGAFVMFASDSREYVIACDRSAAVGMVDPFLLAPVSADSAVWMFLMPNTVTSLRHVWEHPAFGDAPAEPAKFTPLAMDATTQSRKWIEEFAASMDHTYSRVMQAAERWVDCGDYTRDDTEAYKDVWDKFPEFWTHYEVVTDTKVDDKEASFFTCSC